MAHAWSRSAPRRTCNGRWAGLFAFDRAGHQLRNRSNTDQEESSPAVASDGRIFVGADDHYIYADGTLAWRTLTKGMVRGSPSLAKDGTIYIGSEDRNLHALSPDGVEQ